MQHITDPEEVDTDIHIEVLPVTFPLGSFNKETCEMQIFFLKNLKTSGSLLISKYVGFILISVLEYRLGGILVYFLKEKSELDHLSNPLHSNCLWFSGQSTLLLKIVVFSPLSYF